MMEISKDCKKKCKQNYLFLGIDNDMIAKYRCLNSRCNYEKQFKVIVSTPINYNKTLQNELKKEEEENNEYIEKKRKKIEINTNNIKEKKNNQDKLMKAYINKYVININKSIIENKKYKVNYNFIKEIKIKK